MRPCHRAADAVRPCPFRGSLKGSAIDTLILVTLFVVVLGSVIALIVRLLMRRREERERWEAAGRPEPVPRTPEQKEQDRRTAITWGCLVVAVPLVLLGLYTITR